MYRIANHLLVNLEKEGRQLSCVVMSSRETVYEDWLNCTRKKLDLHTLETSSMMKGSVAEDDAHICIDNSLAVVEETLTK